MEILFLHLEGELSGREAKAAASHVEGCWVCRAECDRLSKGMFRFIESCERAELPDPPPNLARFHRKLKEHYFDNPGFSGARPFWRSLLVGGLSASAAAAVVVLYALSQNGAAAQLLQQAQDSSRTFQSPKPRTVIYQKVRIQHRGRVIDRAVYHGEGIPVTLTALPDPDMAKALNSANIRWDDPLSVDDFVAWRKAQLVKWDTLAEGVGGLELSTRPWSQSPVRQASLTLSKLDRHPIERRVEFWDGPMVEVTELALEIHEMPAATFVDRMTSLKLPSSPPVVPEQEPIPALPAPTKPEGDIEDSEIRLRAAFHRIRADVLEAPEIWRSGDHVFFRVTADTPARREEILRAAEGILLVSESVADLRSAAHDRVQVTAQYSTTPPLAKALRDSLGSYEEVNGYLSSVRDAYFRLLSESAALDRLGKRYTRQTLETLSPEVRSIVASLANDHVGNIQQASLKYFELLGHAPAGLTSKSASPIAATCSAWQQASGLLAEDLRRLHSAFFKLFVQFQVEHPVELSAEALLAESYEARRLLQEHLSGLCQVAKK